MIDLQILREKEDDNICDNQKPRNDPGVEEGIGRHNRHADEDNEHAHGETAEGGKEGLLGIFGEFLRRGPSIIGVFPVEKEPHRIIENNIGYRSYKIERHVARIRGKDGHGY